MEEKTGSEGLMDCGPPLPPPILQVSKPEPLIINPTLHLTHHLTPTFYMESLFSD